MSTYNHIRCLFCGCAWQDRSSVCSRHEFRPWVQILVQATAAASKAPAPVSAAPEPPPGHRPDARDMDLAMRLRAGAADAEEAADRIERLSRERDGALAAVEIETLRNTVAAMTEALNTVHARMADLRAALARIEREAVILCSGPDLGGRETWEWAVGQVCSIPHTTRDEAVAAFRDRFGWKGD